MTVVRSPIKQPAMVRSVDTPPQQSQIYTQVSTNQIASETMTGSQQVYQQPSPPLVHQLPATSVLPGSQQATPIASSSIASFVSQSGPSLPLATQMTSLPGTTNYYHQSLPTTFEHAQMNTTSQLYQATPASGVTFMAGTSPQNTLSGLPSAHPQSVYRQLLLQSV